jgi:hypothetical protein
MVPVGKQGIVDAEDPVRPRAHRHTARRALLPLGLNGSLALRTDENGIEHVASLSFVDSYLPDFSHIRPPKSSPMMIGVTMRGEQTEKFQFEK